jgi:GNAT superfamily N-acetyltransferase
MPILVRYASSTQDLDAGYALRRDVFEVEQNIPRPLDRDPYDFNADHVVAFDDGGRCVGTGRIVRLDSRTAQVGRMAVPAEQRGQGIGAQVLDALERMARLRGLSSSSFTRSSPRRRSTRTGASCERASLSSTRASRTSSCASTSSRREDGWARPAAEGLLRDPLGGGECREEAGLPETGARPSFERRADGSRLRLAVRQRGAGRRRGAIRSR